MKSNHITLGYLIWWSKYTLFYFLDNFITHVALLVLLFKIHTKSKRFRSKSFLSVESLKAKKNVLRKFFVTRNSLFTEFCWTGNTLNTVNTP